MPHSQGYKKGISLPEWNLLGTKCRSDAASMSKNTAHPVGV